MTSKLIILGSSNAVPSVGHENTHLLLTTPLRNVLVDCATNPLLRLEQVGLDPIRLTDIILTHFHPDHVSGVPLLLIVSYSVRRDASLSSEDHVRVVPRRVHDVPLARNFPLFGEIG